MCPNKPSIHRLICAAIVVVGTSCDPDWATDSSTICATPVADAGADQSTALGGTVDLDASASAICNSRGSAVFMWSFESVPLESAIDDNDLSENDSDAAGAPSFTPDVAGDYVLSLVIDDGEEVSATDMVVIDVSSGDQPPTADCGGDLSSAIDEIVDLDGSASSDTEGAELTFSWSLSSPTCSGLESEDLFNASGAKPTFVPDCEGVFIVGLVVSDGIQWSEPDICSVDVASGNRSPVADAGESESQGSCAANPHQLSGWGSYDLDGDDLIYAWSVVEVPADSSVTDADISDPSDAGPSLTWDEPGEYILQLQVSDGEEWSAPDVVILTFADLDENGSPVANAGIDQTLEVESTCESLSYVWSCEDCAEQDLELDGTSSFDPNDDDLVYIWSESTGTATFDSEFSIVTTAYLPEQAAEYGVPNSMSFEFTLEAADCEDSSEDTMMVNYTCTGAE